jgi:hypothetical protein
MTVITLGLLEKQLAAALAFVKEKIEAIRWENCQFSLTREAALSCARNAEPSKGVIMELEALLQGRIVVQYTMESSMPDATWPSPIPYETCGTCGYLIAIAGTRCPNCDEEVPS